MYARLFFCPRQRSSKVWEKRRFHDITWKFPPPHLASQAALHQSFSPTSGTRSADNSIATTNGSGSGRPTESGGAGEAAKKEGKEACGTRLLETLLDRYHPDAMWFFAPATPCEKRRE